MKIITTNSHTCTVQLCAADVLELQIYLANARKYNQSVGDHGRARAINHIKAALPETYWCEHAKCMLFNQPG